jgi:hypothetical protein
MEEKYFLIFRRIRWLNKEWARALERPFFRI